MSGGLLQLHWRHPVIGEISETVCPEHREQVRDALFVLGIGVGASDGSILVAGMEGPGEMPVCLRCQAGPTMMPRQLLRQWFGTGEPR
jgi:hypothetical protein